MSGATHIIGGFVFAGTLSSFTDVNIFANPYYIGSCVAFSLLPDIDTTKSWLGKLFYPVAWVIYHKFGHRTLTHSLLFFVMVWVTMLLLFHFGIITDRNYLKIVLFSLLGHYVFDMITVSGVPLFYPFLKNPCVIPGNPAYRFNTSCLRSELIVIGVCGILCFTLQPLFAHGFWTTYNRQFATIRHVDRENKNTEFYVVCEYEYILNAETCTGEAIVIDSKQNELTLFDRRRIIILNADDPQLRVIFTRPRISTIEKRFEEYEFQNVKFDSLQSMLHGKLATGLIQSNKNVRYVENSITYNTNFIKFANRFDFQISATEDTTKVATRATIARLEAAIAQTKQRHQSEMERYNQHQSQIDEIERRLLDRNLSNYERNRLQRELISLRNRRVELPIYQPPTTQLAELEIHKLALIETPVLFSGYMTVYTFGFDENAAVASGLNLVQPVYDCRVLLANTLNYPVSDKYAY